MANIEFPLKFTRKYGVYKGKFKGKAVTFQLCNFSEYDFFDLNDAKYDKNGTDLYITNTRPRGGNYIEIKPTGLSSISMFARYPGDKDWRYRTLFGATGELLRQIFEHAKDDQLYVWLEQ